MAPSFTVVNGGEIDAGLLALIKLFPLKCRLRLIAWHSIPSMSG